MTEAPHVVASMRYLHADVKPSLIRTGTLGTKRGLDGCDEPHFGMKNALMQLPVYDARHGLEQSKADEKRRRLEPPSLAKEGFELHSFFEGDGLADKPKVNYMNHDDIVRTYYPQIISFVKRVTGAALVFPFDHNIRRTQTVAKDSLENSTVKVQEPIDLVHTDYTATSAPRRLLQLTEPPKANDAWKTFLRDRSLIPARILASGSACDGGEERSLNLCEQMNADADGGKTIKERKLTRYVMCNVWKSISEDGAIQQRPLAVCSSDSLVADDMAVYEIHYADRIGENWFGRHAQAHKWFYYPRMEEKEALIFKQWDSYGRLAMEARDAIEQKWSENGAAEEKGSALQSAHEVLNKTKLFHPDREAEGAKTEGVANQSRVGGVGSSDFCIHCAFDDLPPEQDRSALPPRESIEVRCFAFF
eukprot:TRINITY_DN112604_c0_g1_i1.p1 TRINITY_DN112604_c0_g1~~TRINITY_DN112604_c0_g1_i1.p1  ORF type:complete len:419 (+),score=62.39 TRINITY_DN112604_c0_g1_i1:68-1324(+)